MSETSVSLHEREAKWCAVVADHDSPFECAPHKLMRLHRESLYGHFNSTKNTRVCVVLYLVAKQILTQGLPDAEHTAFPIPHEVLLKIRTLIHIKQCWAGRCVGFTEYEGYCCLEFAHYEVDMASFLRVYIKNILECRDCLHLSRDTCDKLAAAMDSVLGASNSDLTIQTALALIQSLVPRLDSARVAAVKVISRKRPRSEPAIAPLPPQCINPAYHEDDNEDDEAVGSHDDDNDATDSEHDGDDGHGSPSKIPALDLDYASQDDLEEQLATVPTEAQVAAALASSAAIGTFAPFYPSQAAVQEPLNPQPANTGVQTSEQLSDAELDALLSDPFALGVAPAMPSPSVLQHDAASVHQAFPSLFHALPVTTATVAAGPASAYVPAFAHAQYDLPLAQSFTQRQIDAMHALIWPSDM